MSKINPNVKDAVETIYELTKDGYTGTLSTLGYTTTIVARLLKERGILKVIDKQGQMPTYRWNEEAMAPTAVFIKSIDDAYKRYQTDKKAKTLENKVKAEVRASKRGIHAIFPQSGHTEEKPQEEPEEAAEEPAGPPVISKASELPNGISLILFTDEELWKELLRRGWSIRDNRLVKTITMNI